MTPWTKRTGSGEAEPSTEFITSRDNILRWPWNISKAVEQRGGALNASHLHRAQSTSALIDAQKTTITSFARRHH
jgi:hypothetical protein